MTEPNSTPLTPEERATLRDLQLRERRAERAAREELRIARRAAFEPLVPLLNCIPIDDLDGIFNAAEAADLDNDTKTRLSRLRQIMTYDLRGLHETLTRLDTVEPEVDTI